LYKTQKYDINKTLLMKGVEIMRRHEISDNDWESVADLLPIGNRGEGRPSKSNAVQITE
jgi:hypothetical protein